MSFTSLNSSDFVVSADSITSTLWSGEVPTLTQFFTSSQTSSFDTFLDVYQTGSLRSDATVQFSIAYGEVSGSGSAPYNALVTGSSPSRVTYGQYRTLVNGDENTNFNFGTGNTDSRDMYALTVNRARYKEKLFPGSLNLVLSSSNTVATSTQIHLTDNSNVVTLPTYYGTQRAYQLISGSDGTSFDGGNGFTPASGSYGLFLPDISTILLNAPALNDNTAAGGGINLATNSGSDTSGNNPTKLFNHISGSVGDVNGNVFQLNSQETISSDFVFIRARNSEFNYTENPSFISGSTGEVIYTYFIDNPNTFPTTVGLYNDSNDLLAVAKLSKPIQKDFTKEALIRVKLDF